MQHLCSTVRYGRSRSPKVVDFGSDRNGYELCACTSDRERSTRAGEACTSDRKPVNGNPDSDSYSDSCLCECSLRDRQMDALAIAKTEHLHSIARRSVKTFHNMWSELLQEQVIWCSLTNTKFGDGNATFWAKVRTKIEILSTTSFPVVGVQLSVGKLQVPRLFDPQSRGLTRRNSGNTGKLSKNILSV